MALTRDEINARKRQKRLEARKLKMAGKHCLNCTIFIAEHLKDRGRSYLYCRTCIKLYKKELDRDRCKRYYYRKKAKV